MVRDLGSVTIFAGVRTAVGVGLSPEATTWVVPLMYDDRLPAFVTTLIILIKF